MGVLDEEGGSQSMRAVYGCRQCGKTYCWKKTLQRHMKLECGGKEPQFPCPVCNYRFKYKSHRLRHMTKVHQVTHEEAQAVIDQMKGEDQDPDVEYMELTPLSPSPTPFPAPRRGHRSSGSHSLSDEG